MPTFLQFSYVFDVLISFFKKNHNNTNLSKYKVNYMVLYYKG